LFGRNRQQKAQLGNKKMFEEDLPVHVRELQWLAYYYKLHGYIEKSREILASIVDKRAILSTDNIVDIFTEDKKEA